MTEQKDNHILELISQFSLDNLVKDTEQKSQVICLHSKQMRQTV